LAIGLVGVSVASAAPEFTPTGATVTGTGGTGVLTGDGETLTCASDVESGGVVTSATLIGGIVIHFVNCTNKNGVTGTSCPANSSNTTTPGLILTNTLHAVLGLSLPIDHVVAVLLPVSGSSFVELEGTCLGVDPANVAGQVAGIVNPVGTSTTKGTLAFELSNKTQGIKEVDLSTGGLIKPKLTVAGETATEETSEVLTFTGATEVT